MLFNSYNFLLFFPIVTLVYFVIPKKTRYIWLLIASYYFYMSWDIKYGFLLFFSTIVTYIAGLLISKADSKKKGKKNQKKDFLIISIFLCLYLLFMFKYLRFAIININSLLSYLNLKTINLSLNSIVPIGISFYILQSIGYTIDVYRGNIKAEKNFLKYALFVSFFPQLVAGPIERSKNLLRQINEEHKFDFQRVKDGILLMVWGFFLKLVIADRIAIIVDTVFDKFPAYKGLYIVFAVILFGIQIYCDFAGYSTIAIGSAKVMGFKIMDNFNSPYMSMSVAEFWRRWHISLSTWFRDYLYIPLGGNRKGKIRKYFNLMIVFLVSGLWHGANWTYVIWGGLNRTIYDYGGFIKKT